MTTTRFLLLPLAAALVLAMPPLQAQQAGRRTAAAASSCDRRCLLTFLTNYTEALTDNDTSRLTVSPNLRVTNNGVVTTLGHGDVWGPARRLPYRQAFVDPVTGSAIFYGVVTMSTRPTRADTPNAGANVAPRWWFYVVRLKVAERKITEVEEIAYEKPKNGFGADPAQLTLPDRIFDTVLPPDERSTREQLFAAANRYFDAVSQKGSYRDAPWHPECQRLELGTFTVNAPRTAGSCGGEFQTPSVKWNVSNRRFYVADVERGVVIAAGNFMTPPEYPTNNGSVVIEAFKVQDGLIRFIFAFFRGNGQLHSGWGQGPGS
ncbi:MAG TPA: hypothetical protein VG871_23270 [Vicinamibacterales bacterium]|nr:hypothetical protein [Vicinamibacterales bacterium]